MARRIKVDMRIRIAKAVSELRWDWSRQPPEEANLKNISHLGAYFEYQGSQCLTPGDIIRLDLDVSLPFENKDMDSGERLPMDGLAGVVHIRHSLCRSCYGVGVGFLEPLAMKLNSS
ncbi:MAG: hypothetical protein ACP5IL_11270 [Syntrophobacteraceae bacterium]